MCSSNGRCSYIISFSGALALLNMVPGYFLDGQWAFDTGIDLVLNWLNSSGEHAEVLPASMASLKQNGQDKEPISQAYATHQEGQLHEQRQGGKGYSDCARSIEKNKAMLCKVVHVGFTALLAFNFLVFLV